MCSSFLQRRSFLHCPSGDEGTHYSDSITFIRSTPVNLALWLPAMFALGFLAMGLCYAFLKACERI